MDKVLNNQLNRKSNITQHLPLADEELAQWARGWSSHSGRDWGYAWAQQLGLPSTKADLATATAKC